MCPATADHRVHAVQAGCSWPLVDDPSVSLHCRVAHAENSWPLEAAWRDQVQRDGRTTRQEKGRSCIVFAFTPRPAVPCTAPPAAVAACGLPAGGSREQGTMQRPRILAPWLTRGLAQLRAFGHAAGPAAVSVHIRRRGPFLSRPPPPSLQRRAGSPRPPHRPPGVATNCSVAAVHAKPDPWLSCPPLPGLQRWRRRPRRRA